MTQTQLLIPEKIKVGYQERGDTYTARLGYVIYYDHKGVLRKEKSLQGWRDQKIDPQEFKNEPTEGFVLNRKVGGYKSDWNYRTAKIRIYDPRDWEFEITVENLLFILSVGDCSRGKGLEGKFVYAWEGQELVLMPVACENYKACTEYTELQSCKVKAKELIPGASYNTKKQEVLTYLGKFIKHVVESDYYWHKEKTGPKQVFWNGNDFVFLSGLTSIATLHSDVVSPDYAELVDRYNKSIYGSKVTKFFTKKEKKNTKNNGWYHRSDEWAKEQPDGSYLVCVSSFKQEYDSKKQQYVNHTTPESVTQNYRASIKDGLIVTQSIGKTCYRDESEHQRQKNSYRYYGGSQKDRWFNDWIEPTGVQLWAELESGSKFQVNSYCLIDRKAKEIEDDEEDYDDED